MKHHRNFSHLKVATRSNLGGPESCTKFQIFPGALDTQPFNGRWHVAGTPRISLTAAGRIFTGGTTFEFTVDVGRRMS